VALPTGGDRGKGNKINLVEFNLELTTAVLKRTPATLNALLSDLSEPWIYSNEGPHTFSPFDVVGHLIDAEETNWMPRARIIWAGGSDPRFEPFDRFRHQSRNVGRSLGSLLAEFTQLRAASMAEFLAWQLKPEDLERTGLHPDFGEVSLKQLLATWTVHDLSHIAQTVRVMAKQYRSEVGPWAAFLPLLKPNA